MSGASHEIQHNSNNKKIALLIAVLALFLAISETLSKSYQTEVLISNEVVRSLGFLPIKNYSSVEYEKL